MSRAWTIGPWNVPPEIRLWASPAPVGAPSHASARRRQVPRACAKAGSSPPSRRSSTTPHPFGLRPHGTPGRQPGMLSAAVGAPRANGRSAHGSGGRLAGCGPAAGARRVSSYRNELISIVSSRPGPTPIAEIGAPDISSSAFTYAWAFFGRSEKDLALLMSSLQPGSIS